MINCESGFFLYAKVIVEYSGRAKSIIGPANLVAIHKLDGTFIVHGASRCLPINYQRPKSRLKLVEDTLICSGNNEEIKVQIMDIYQYYEINEWCNERLRMTGTEKQLCDYICENIASLLGVEVKEINREVPVIHGSIDILATDSHNVKHIIEVKRKRATKAAVFQLKKYCDDMMSKMQCIGYIAAPDIGKDALILSNEYGYKYMRVENKLVF